MPASLKDMIQSLRQWFNRKVDKQVFRLTRGSRLEHGSDRSARDYGGIRFIFNPVFSYWTLIASVVLLTGVGLMMVFSSTTANLASTNQPVWQGLLRQTLYAAVGIVFALGLQMIPRKFFTAFIWTVLIAAIGLQFLTFTPLGLSAGGNSGWIQLGPVSLQPAEVLKFALCLWLPMSLIRAQENLSRQTKPTVKSFCLAYSLTFSVYILSFALVLAGKDLGTAMIVAILGILALFISGFPLRGLGGIVLVGVLFVFAFALSGNSNRMNRILATYGGCSAREVAQSKAICFQSLHGDYALATGGFWGVGLGNSREKWSYLPAADNDYIFAIIGEELGFIGALFVILLIVVMAWSLINLSLRHQNIYMQIALLCFTVWFTGQSFVNILVVLGLLPVMGLPLPFISSGGSSLVMCLLGSSACIRFARQQEDVRATLTRG